MNVTLKELLRKINELETEKVSLEKIRQQYQMLIDTIPHGIQENDVHGLITFSNAAHHRMTRFSEGELIGKKYIWDLLCSEKEKNELRQYLAFLIKEQPAPEPYITKNLTKDGKAVDVQVDWDYKRDNNGDVTGFVSIITDITKRLEAESLLLQSEERFKYLSEATNEAVIFTHQTKIIDANKAALTMFGYELLDEFKGKSPLEFISPGERDLVRKKLLKKTVIPYEVRGLKKDGTEFDIEVRAKNFMYKKKSVRVTNIKDITIQKELERHIQRTQKLEALGTLSGGIAHEFNNILASIRGYAELSIHKLSGNEVVKRYLQKIFDSSGRASNLVQQILTFSRMETTQLKHIDIRSIIKEAVQMLRVTIPANIEIIEKIQHVPFINGDANQIHQIVINIANNAYHAMEKTGGNFEIVLRQKGEEIQLTFSDTGTGISQKHLTKVFDPFFTTKEVGKGTGLGLAVVHGIVERHHGRIVINSEKGNGTTVTIYFPIVQELGRQEQKTEEFRDVTIKGIGHILVVEDETDIAELYKNFLESVGYTVTMYYHGEDALGAFKRDPHRFDLVFTDMAMPKMTGKELIKNILEIRPDIPIILSTGYSSVLSEKEAISIGVRKYLTKPIGNLLILKNVIEESLHPQ